VELKHGLLFSASSSLRIVSSTFTQSKVVVHHGKTVFESTSFPDSVMTIDSGLVTLLDSQFYPNSQSPSVIDISAGSLSLSGSSFCPPADWTGLGITCSVGLNATVIGDLKPWRVSSSCATEAAFPMLTSATPSITISACHPLLFLILLESQDAYFTLNLTSKSDLSTSTVIGTWDGDAGCLAINKFENQGFFWSLSSQEEGIVPQSGKDTTYCYWINITSFSETEQQAVELEVSIDYTPRSLNPNNTQMVFLSSFVFNFQRPSVSLRYDDSYCCFVVLFSRDLAYLTSLYFTSTSRNLNSVSQFLRPAWRSYHPLESSKCNCSGTKRRVVYFPSN
jgi:hypothetical protein